MGITVEEVTAVHVGDGKGITVETVSHLEVTFIVSTPDIIGSFCLCLWTPGMFSSEPSFGIGDETISFEDIRRC
jgi:hypothetical protein